MLDCKLKVSIKSKHTSERLRVPLQPKTPIYSLKRKIIFQVLISTYMDMISINKPFNDNLMCKGDILKFEIFPEKEQYRIPFPKLLSHAILNISSGLYVWEMTWSIITSSYNDLRLKINRKHCCVLTRLKLVKNVIIR